MTSSSPMVLLYVPCPSKDSAENLSRDLLKNQLVVCANIMPQSHSYYLWQGVVHQSFESVLLLKTLSSLAQQAMDYIQRNHPYEQPAILSLPIIQLSEGVQKWAETELLGIGKEKKI